jgi:hypothetical protein
MTKIVTTREAEAPAVIVPISGQHRSAASARGFSIDATVAALRQSLGEARFALEAVIGAAPEGDGNVAALKSLHRKLLASVGRIMSRGLTSLAHGKMSKRPTACCSSAFVSAGARARSSRPRRSRLSCSASSSVPAGRTSRSPAVGRWTMPPTWRRPSLVRLSPATKIPVWAVRSSTPSCSMIIRALYGVAI